MRILKRAAAIAIVMLAVGCGRAPDRRATATAYAVSHGGPITVEVTVKGGGRIADIKITEFNDLPAIGGEAARIITERVLTQGTTHVDAVSGATVTSMALLSAIEDAARAAGARLIDTEKVSPAAADSLQCDVLVVGGGGAGLMAAYTAAESGADVIICERLSIVGGSTAKSGGSIIFYTEGLTDPSVEALHPNESIALLKKIGVEFVLYQDRSLYAAIDRERGIATGSAIVTALSGAAEKAGARIVTDTRVTSLVTDSTGTVVGALAQSGGRTIQITAGSVIICTGGDAAAEIAEATGAVMVMSSVGSDGSGMSIAGRIGATATKPTPLIATVTCPAPEAGILVTRAGTRFCNEAAGGTEIAGALLSAGQYECWFVSDRPIASESAVTAGSIASLAELIKTPELQKTVDEYNTFCRLREDSGFKKPQDMLQAITGKSFYAEKRAVIVYGTVGGLSTDQFGAVQGANGSIANLYSAGEASNVSQFGLSYGGEGYSLAQVFYSARIAGSSAAKNAAGDSD